MTKRIFSIFSTAALLISSITACGTETSNVLPLENIHSQTTISSVNRNASSYSEDVQAFVSNASKLGIKLSDEQLKTISIQRHVAPNGKWAARPAEHLSAEQNLDVHFRKHGITEFHLKSKEEYLQKAIAFQKRTGPTVTYYFDITSFDKGYQSNVVKYDSKTHEFGAKKPDGEITTYYTNSTPAPKRFIVVPEDFNF